MMRRHGWLHVIHLIAHKRKYNPQGGRIPHISLPRVASYRRQPWAIESTTPMGLPYHCPFMTITTTGMRITLRWSCAHHGHLSSHHNAECAHVIPWGCPPHYHSSTNKFARIVRNIIMHYQTISYLYRPTPLFCTAHNTRIAHNIITHQ